jgi:hypothetical protein
MANDSSLFSVGSNFSGSLTPSIGGSLISDFLGQASGLDSIFGGDNDFNGANNLGFGKNLGAGSNFGRGIGLSSSFDFAGGQGAPNGGLTQNFPELGNVPQQGGGFLGGLNNFSNNFLNKDFLLGSKDSIGALTGGAAIAQTLGGLYNSNREFNLGKKQYNDKLAVFNNNQQNLKEDSIRDSKNILDSSDFSKDFTQEEREAYINQRTYKPKTI